MEIIRVKISASSIFKSSIYAAEPILTRVRYIEPAKVTHLHLVAEDIGDTFEAVVVWKAQLRALEIQIQVTRQIRKLASLRKIVQSPASTHNPVLYCKPARRRMIDSLKSGAHSRSPKRLAHLPLSKESASNPGPARPQKEIRARSVKAWSPGSPDAGRCENKEFRTESRGLKRLRFLEQKSDAE
jgi:hypothetical protein